MGTTEHNPMTSVSTGVGEETRSAPRDGVQPPNGSPGLEAWKSHPLEWLQHHSLQALGENIDWWEVNDREIARQHPDWIGKYVVIASRTPSKILAVADDRWEAVQAALEEGKQSPELLEAARRAELRPGDLVCPFRLGDHWLLLDD